MGDDWSGNWDIAAAFEMPEFAAIVEIVSANVFPTVANDLRAAVGNGNGRRAPRSASLFAGHAPELRAPLRIEHSEIFFAEHIALNDDFAIVQNGRARETPLKSVVVVGAGVHFAEVIVPKQNTVHVKAEEAFRAKNGDDARAIRCWRRIAMGSFGVSLDARDSFIAEPVPEEFPGVFIETEQTPLVRFLFLVGCAVAIDADFEVGLSARFDGSSDIDAILPDDWASVAKAGNRFLPTNVFATFQIPFRGSGLIGKAGAIRAAELRPIGRRRESGKRQDPENE